MYDIFLILLAEKGVTVADVSRATGINQSTLSNWKKRRNALSAKNAALIADYFGVSVGYLMGHKKPTESKGDPYFLDDDARDLAQFLYENPEYKTLFDATRKVKKEDIKTVRDMIDLATR